MLMNLDNTSYIMEKKKNSKSILTTRSSDLKHSSSRPIQISFKLGTCNLYWSRRKTVIAVAEKPLSGTTGGKNSYVFVNMRRQQRHPPAATATATGCTTVSYVQFGRIILLFHLLNSKGQVSCKKELTMTLRRVVFICALLQFLSVCKANWIVKSKNTEDAEVPKSESGREQRQDIPVEYGADVSFPMHHNPVSTNYPWLDHNAIPGTPTPEKYKDMVLQPLGDRDKFYHDFMKGCASHNGKNARRCQMTEDDRIAMTLRQPQSMQNYTRDGYKKIKAPPEVWKLITEFWEKNKNNKKLENWGAGNTYTNNWEAPTYMVSVEDSGLRGGGAQLKQAIWNAARDTIQEWTGEELTQCSLYGIRIYEEGAVLVSKFRVRRKR